MADFSNLRKALNPSYQKQSIQSQEAKALKSGLKKLLQNLSQEGREESNKNNIRDFLKEVWYSNHYINTTGDIDLAIFDTKNDKGKINVILECKSLKNRGEMVTVDDMNRKAMHELLLYYLRERESNPELCHLIITNGLEFFIFDAKVFEEVFYKNKKLKKVFQKFKNKNLSDDTTKFFYKEIAPKYIQEVNWKEDEHFTYLNIEEFESLIGEHDITPEEIKNEAINLLYKIFSPEHLLKLPFANDSNSLDQGFYQELLHILGLEENKKGGKKTIGVAKKKQNGSFLENIIYVLKINESLLKIPNLQDYGDSQNEQEFKVALELLITWLNRILFLKLLEAQLCSYHKKVSENSVYEKFLVKEKINNYGKLNTLFFEVLALTYTERISPTAKKEFSTIPYLNSSLFDRTPLEDTTICINELLPDLTIDIFPKSVLKDDNGNKRTGKIDALEYLLSFLDAFDFSSDASEPVQKENKRLINASVLGLIFEKLNGYQDGSFFTPGYITMYMSKQVVEKAVIQKFNEEKGWNCKSIGEICRAIDDKKDAVGVINKLKICDPSVGSGHFLVSVLNELLAIKQELGLLGVTLGDHINEMFHYYKIEVVNDELIITDRRYTKLFNYQPNDDDSLAMQKALFEEKKIIIENNLFGVDINPNSVKICRLRLWIELLKNAYYPDFRNRPHDLKTLPNIDINIKCGNSLLSKFEFKEDLTNALKNSRWSITDYKEAINKYRNADSKNEKNLQKEKIKEIEEDFERNLIEENSLTKKINKLKSSFWEHNNQKRLYSLTGKELKDFEDRNRYLSSEIEKTEKERTEIITGKAYHNAFEWRYKFPEVLNNECDFIGFDVIIGNPPYARVQELEKTQPLAKLHYERCFEVAQKAYDQANLFFELAVKLSAPKALNAYIFPHKFMNAKGAQAFRQFVNKGRYIHQLTHFGANMVFTDALTYTCIAFFSKKPNQTIKFKRFSFGSDLKQITDKHHKNTLFPVTYEQIRQTAERYDPSTNQWIFFDSPQGHDIFKKMYHKSIRLSEILEGIYVGLQTSRDELYILEKQIDGSFKVPLTGKIYDIEPDLLKPFLMGKNVHRYANLSTNKFVFFPYKVFKNRADIVPIDKIKEKYPKTYQYVMEHEKYFKARESGKAAKMKHWHTYIYPKNLHRFEQDRIASMMICSKHSNVTQCRKGLYHTTKVYTWVLKQHIKKLSYEFLLGIANSQLFWWFIKTTGDTLQGDARTFTTNYIEKFPLPIDIAPEYINGISAYAEEILAINKKEPTQDTAAQEREINKLVYQIYNLTPTEIALVEGREEESEAIPLVKKLLEKVA